MIKSLYKSFSKTATIGTFEPGSKFFFAKFKQGGKMPNVVSQAPMNYEKKQEAYHHPYNYN